MAFSGSFKQFTRTKDIDDVIHQNDEDPEETGQPGLLRRLSVFDLMGFGIGIVIGTGIFTLTGVEAKNHAGPAISLAFIIAGIVAMLAAVCYAELAAAVRAAPVDGPQSLVTSLVASALGARATPRDDLAIIALKLI